MRLQPAQQACFNQTLMNEILWRFTFALLEHLLHVGCFPLQSLDMLPLLVLELAELAGEALPTQGALATL